MKCIKLSGDKVIIHRVSEAVAMAMVEAGKAKYVTKSVWKKYGRKYMSASEQRRIEYMEDNS